MMSGMRKPSPISISSPRETTTSPPAGQFVERQKDGGGVVVDGDARARPAAAPAGRRYARRACRAGRRRDRIPGWNSRAAPPCSQRRASQIGMQHHAGGVDDAPQRRPFERRERPFDARFDRRAIAPAVADFRAHFLQHSSDRRHHHGPREPRQGGRKPFEHLMHGGQVAQLFAFGHEFDGTGWRERMQRRRRFCRPLCGLLRYCTCRHPQPHRQQSRRMPTRRFRLARPISRWCRQPLFCPSSPHGRWDGGSSCA